VRKLSQCKVTLEARRWKFEGSVEWGVFAMGNTVPARGNGVSRVFPVLYGKYCINKRIISDWVHEACPTNHRWGSCDGSDDYNSAAWRTCKIKFATKKDGERVYRATIKFRVVLDSQYQARADWNFSHASFRTFANQSWKWNTNVTAGSSRSAANAEDRK